MFLIPPTPYFTPGSWAAPRHATLGSDVSRRGPLSQSLNIVNKYVAEIASRIGQRKSNTIINAMFAQCIFHVMQNNVRHYEGINLMWVWVESEMLLLVTINTPAPAALSEWEWELRWAGEKVVTQDAFLGRGVSEEWARSERIAGERRRFWKHRE